MDGRAVPSYRVLDPLPLSGEERECGIPMAIRADDPLLTNSIRLSADILGVSKCEYAYVADDVAHVATV